MNIVWYLIIGIGSHSSGAVIPMNYPTEQACIDAAHKASDNYKQMPSPGIRGRYDETSDYRLHYTCVPSAQ